MKLLKKVWKQKCMLAMLLFAMTIVGAFGTANAASYGQNYQRWSQGASDYAGIRSCGCWVVAQAKLLRETNVETSSSFNPDVYYLWEKDNGLIDSDFKQTKGADAPVTYANQKGKNLKFWGSWETADNQIWFDINAGYYTILEVVGYNADGKPYTHYVMVDNATSKATGQIYIYESYWDYSEIPYLNGLVSRPLSKYAYVSHNYVYQAYHTHSWNSGVVTTQATCQNAGVKTYTCTSCGETKTETIAQKEHNYTKQTQKATLNKNGYTCEVCQGCGREQNKTVYYYPEKITLSKTTYVYDGKAKKPTVTVTGSNGKTIGAENYTVSYPSGRKNPGKYTVTIKFKGNYSGTAKKTFTITAKSHTHSYKKSSITKATTKKNGAIKYTCSCGATKSTTIYYPKTIKLSKTSYAYDGKEKKPSVTVTGSNGKTIGAKNYTVSYPSGRKNPGKYTVTIKFKGNYSGTVKKTFTITAKSHTHSYKSTITKATTKKNGVIKYTCSCGATKSSTIYYPKTIKLSKTSYAYDGKEKKPSVTVTGSDGKTISAKNYTVSYSSGRKKVGTYKVTIKFKGNYSGTVTRTYKIKNAWKYTSKLPSGVTSSRYEIQYKNTYKTTTQYYENSGSVYESNMPLSTSNTRVLVGYYYYHFCGGSTGTYANYEQSGGYVHFDSISADRVTVAASGDDNGHTWYILNWNSTSDQVYCASGTTCNGAYGNHGSRSRAWYRMYQYQNKVVKTQTTTTTSDWSSKKDSKAVKTEYRYRLK